MPPKTGNFLNILHLIVLILFFIIWIRNTGMVKKKVISSHLVSRLFILVIILLSGFHTVYVIIIIV